MQEQTANKILRKELFGLSLPAGKPQIDYHFFEYILLRKDFL